MPALHAPRTTQIQLTHLLAVHPLSPTFAHPACPPHAPLLQYKTQFAVSATGQLRLTALDAKVNIQLLLKATGSARLTFGGTSVDITGARGWRTSCADWTAAGLTFLVAVLGGLCIG